MEQESNKQAQETHRDADLGSVRRRGDEPMPDEPNQGEWDAFLSHHLCAFLGEFQALPVIVGPRETDARSITHVHIPYMLQSTAIVDDPRAFRSLKPHHQARLLRVRHARESAPREVRMLLERHFYDDNGKERLLARGRARLDDVRRLLQDAVDRGLIPVPPGRPHLDGGDLRVWLKTYGIGVDCSAFVQQALSRLTGAGHAAIQGTAQQDRDHDVGWLRTFGVYADVMGQPGRLDRFAHVSTPSQARPGDVLVKRGHMRIVARVEPSPDGSVVLHLAESISATGIPRGLAHPEADIGPRLIQIRYPDPNAPIERQTPFLKLPGRGQYEADETERAYVLGRLRTLERMRLAHPAPDRRDSTTSAREHHEH